MIIDMIWPDKVLSPLDLNLHQITEQVFNIRKSADVHGEY